MQKWDVHSDFHTHTTYSHGTGSVEDNVIAARRAGLRCVAITDHAVRHPLVGVRPSRIPAMRADVDAVQKKYPDIRVLLGMEANLIGMQGEIDLRPQDIRQLDIVLAGYHLSAVPKRVSDIFRIQAGGVFKHVFRTNTKAQRERNTEMFMRAVQKNPIDILTHPGFRLDVDYERIGQACAEYGTYIEISSRHRVPDAEALQALAACGAQFVINSDAHKPTNIAHWDWALQQAEAAGIGPDRIVNIGNRNIVWRSRRELIIDGSSEGV